MKTHEEMDEKEAVFLAYCQIRFFSWLTRLVKCHLNTTDVHASEFVPKPQSFWIPFFACSVPFLIVCVLIFLAPRSEVAKKDQVASQTVAQLPIQPHIAAK